MILEVRREVLERSAPEHATDHRSSLEKRLRSRVEVVDASGDERLERVRHAGRRAVARSALDEHPNRLLDEERVALCAIEHVLRQRGGRSPEAPASWPSSFSTSSALVLRQRLELDRGRADPPAAPAWPRVEQLRPGETEDEQRRAHPVGEVLDEVEQRRLSPVDVLEEEDERLHVGDPLHDLARRPRDLLRAALALERLHEPRGERQHVGNDSSAQHSRSFSNASSSGSSSEMPAAAFTISPAAST